MPDVGSYQFRGRDGSAWKTPVNVQGHDGTGWKRAKNVYAHNGNQWLEVWNSSPEMVVTGFTASTTSLSLTGTADPNTFATTARFDYRVVGAPTWTATGNTTFGMGDGVDTPVAYSKAISTFNPWQNWEARAVGTNTAGTGISATVQRDCRQQGVNGGSGWSYTSVNNTVNCSDCQSCGSDTKVVTTYTWTKSGCPQYTTTSETACTAGCGTWITTDYHDPGGPPLTVINGALSQYVVWNLLGGGWWYTDANGNPSFGCYDAYGEFGYFGPSSVQYCSVATNTYRVVGPTVCVPSQCC